MEDARKDSPLELLEGAQPLDPRFLVSKTLEEYICFYLSHYFCGDLLQLAEEMNTIVDLMVPPFSIQGILFFVLCFLALGKIDGRQQLTFYFTG